MSSFIHFIASFKVSFLVWSPPKPVTSLAVNTDPDDPEKTQMSPLPAPRVILSDADQATLTSPPVTRNVAIFTDSTDDLELDALLRDTDDIDSLK